MFHRFALFAVLFVLVSSAAQAASLVAMRFSDGWYLFGDTGAALLGQKLPHHLVNSVQVGHGITMVRADNSYFFYGLTPQGIVCRKVASGLISSVELGEEIAVVRAEGRILLYGLTPNGIVEFLAADRYPTSIQVSGKLVLINFAGSYALYATSPTGITRIQLAACPSSIQLGRDAGVISFPTSGTWVVTLGTAGFHSVQASKGHPSTVLIPPPLQQTPGQKLKFDALHTNPAQLIRGSDIVGPTPDRN